MTNTFCNDLWLLILSYTELYTRDLMRFVMVNKWFAENVFRVRTSTFKCTRDRAWDVAPNYWKICPASHVSFMFSGALPQLHLMPNLQRVSVASTWAMLRLHGLRITHLDVNDANVDDYEHVAGTLRTLKCLHCDCQPSASTLLKFTALTSLHTDLTLAHKHMPMLQRLTTLKLTFATCSLDLSPLTQLRILRINCRLARVDISALTNLTSLYAGHMSVDLRALSQGASDYDCQRLCNYTSLTKLTLVNYDVTYDNLMALPNLTDLGLYNHGINTSPCSLMDRLPNLRRRRHYGGETTIDADGTITTAVQYQ